MSTDKIILPPNAIRDNLERRNAARAELAVISGIDIYGYLLTTTHVRRDKLPIGLNGHALVDVLNILSDSDDEPRFMWRDTKKRLMRDKPQLCENITQLKLPSWADDKRYPVDVLDKGYLFNFIYALNTKLALRFQEAFAEDLKQYPEDYHAAILNELDRPTGWAGTRNHLIIAEHYEDGDYDNPRQPIGNPPEPPTLWRPKGGAS